MYSKTFPLRKSESKRMGFRKRKSVSLVEVLVATAISAFVTISTIASLVYFQRVSRMNHRLAQITNLIEFQMEDIKNQTWYSLGDPDEGRFKPDPDDDRDGAWPRPDPDVYTSWMESRTSTITDAGVSENFTGVTADVEVWYAPIVMTHIGNGLNGATLEYDIRYWKVEVAVILEGSQRIRTNVDMDPDRPGDQDIWSAVTYISELSGRGDAEFSIRSLQKLRERRRLGT